MNLLSRHSIGSFFFFFFSSTSLLLPTHLPQPSHMHAQSCNPMDCSLPGSSVHGLFHARILEWVAISFSWVLKSDNLCPIIGVFRLFAFDIIIELIRLKSTYLAICSLLSKLFFNSVFLSLLLH